MYILTGVTEELCQRTPGEQQNACGAHKLRITSQAWEQVILPLPHCLPQQDHIRAVGTSFL